MPVELELNFCMQLFKYSNQFFQQVLDVAKYQKVVLVYDQSSNTKFIQLAREKLSKDTIFFAVAINNPILKSLILDGTKCVIECVKASKFLTLIDMLDDNIVLMSVAFDDFVFKLKRVDNHSVFVSNGKKTIVDLLMIANMFLENMTRAVVNGQLPQYPSYVKIIDMFFDRKISNFDFAKAIFLLPQDIKVNTDILQEITSSNFPAIYLYLRLVAIGCLFQSFQNNSVEQLDVYKVYQNDIEKINMCYNLLFDERMIFCFKNQTVCTNIITQKILKKIKIKNTINKSKIKNSINTLKINAKILNVDNLLKHCYLHNIFNNI